MIVKSASLYDPLSGKYMDEKKETKQEVKEEVKAEVEVPKVETKKK